MIADLHTHTHHSFDGEDGTVAERVRHADELGLRFLAVTDHVEINRFFPAEYYGAEESEMYNYDGQAAFFGSLAETDAARNTGAVTILCGAEIGQIPQNPALAEMLYADARLDLVIGSVHELPGRPDFFFLDYAKEDIPALIAAYFAEVLRLAETGFFDTLAHLTYGLRYLPDRSAVSLEPYYPVIDRIFDCLIAADRALELNGSGLRHNPAYTDPDLPLLQRYFRRGGRRLTLGSDAHSTRFTGYGMAALEDMARSAGFTEITVFRKHIPEQIPLD